MLAGAVYHLTTVWKHQRTEKELRDAYWADYDAHPGNRLAEPGIVQTGIDSYAIGILTAMPVYNNEEFILQTLESLARQALPPDRVLVCDDGSTDRTEQIVRAFKDLKC